ncbi:MAG: lipopolysaccharide/colanic/teichoic acid biosynthesis glycosyltransferase [Planctomycetota bacterium]|jgi:lipopolysaccharide/colanic/teichoic acid biosynthesis glycosyltransferase
MYPFTKRAIDVLVAGMALFILSPVLAVLAIAIRYQDGGPALYVQERVGRGGRPFRFIKFRSMSIASNNLRESVIAQAGQRTAVRFKDRRDPRITPLGRFLRRTSLDELPQLWSVLVGDMSLVGPRPPLPSEVAAYDRRMWRRLDVEPGLTCTWQVSGRSDIDFEQQIELDLDYVQCRGMWFDLMLLARTPAAVLSGRGAY